MKQKNFLLINVDHWSAKLLGCCGNTNLMTPTLDALIRDGILFENHYSTCPVCIPARRSLMTGTFPSTHGDRVYSDKMLMPDVTTLAQAFRNNGYQAYAVGKLHVYPQRDRIGFDDVISIEEGRYEFGCTDDYEAYLAEEGVAGMEFMHGMGSNTYYTRPWHLAEKYHPTNYVTREMCKMIKRKDPTRPAFFYCSYIAPHPPLLPLQEYLDMYSEEECDEAVTGDWVDDEEIFKYFQSPAANYSEKERKRARRAFYAICTHVDNQIRLLIGTLKECGLINDTIIGFTSDHGDSLFDHKMVAKRNFYEGSTHVPFFLSGKPLAQYRGQSVKDITCHEDIMPTLLSLAGIEIPKTVEGIDIFSEKRDMLYGEISEGVMATRMVRYKNLKLIYYPYGNVFQLFDLEKDKDELQNVYNQSEYKESVEQMKAFLLSHLYGDDLSWISGDEFIGHKIEPYKSSANYTLNNQRGYHNPPPQGIK